MKNVSTKKKKKKPGWFTDLEWKYSHGSQWVKVDPSNSCLTVVVGSLSPLRKTISFLSTFSFPYLLRERQVVFFVGYYSFSVGV